MKKSRNLWLGMMLMIAAVCVGCNDDYGVITHGDLTLYAVARQSADASLQYKAEMPLFSLNNIKSYNPETGELVFENVVFDKHLFYDAGCQYRIYFYDGNHLLFDARAVSFFSSAGYFSDLTFQCSCFGPGDEFDASERHFYIRYGYPGTIMGDETIKALMEKNAAGMERFVTILHQAGKIVNTKF